MTCEAALTKTFYLLAHFHMAVRGILERVEQGQLEVEYFVINEFNAEDSLSMHASLPMSFADACLANVLTINSDSKVCAKTDEKWCLYCDLQLIQFSNQGPLIVDNRPVIFKL
jgi:hypothetical protein